ncbi:MAG TPA: hypothetical protein VFN91_09030 [Myxococcaceae bacterium]|nr:hypothetical protein [Myxococcaceae bacterium]
MSAPAVERVETQVLPRPGPKSHPPLRLDPRPRSRAEGIVEAIQTWLDAQL